MARRECGARGDRGSRHRAEGPIAPRRSLTCRAGGVTPGCWVTVVRMHRPTRHEPAPRRRREARASTGRRSCARMPGLDAPSVHRSAGPDREEPTGGSAPERASRYGEIDAGRNSGCRDRRHRPAGVRLLPARSAPPAQPCPRPARGRARATGSWGRPGPPRRGRRVAARRTSPRTPLLRRGRGGTRSGRAAAPHHGPRCRGPSRSTATRTPPAPAACSSR